MEPMTGLPSSKKLSTIIFLTAFVGTVMACVYVVLYNYSSQIIQNERMKHGGGVLFNLTEYFINLQWYAFVVPFFRACSMVMVPQIPKLTWRPLGFNISDLV